MYAYKKETFKKDFWEENRLLLHLYEKAKKEYPDMDVIDALTNPETKESMFKDLQQKMVDNRYKLLELTYDLGISIGSVIGVAVPLIIILIGVLILSFIK